jgi:hypothetical protein
MTGRDQLIIWCVFLEELERIFPTSLAVIGVHSAKFENEKLDDQIQHAIQRYGFFMTLSLKNDVNEYVGVLKDTDEKSRIRIRYTEVSSVPK